MREHDAVVAFVRDVLAQTLGPSVAVAIVHRGDVALVHADGMREPDVPASASTPYRVASVTKPFVAAALLQAAENGLVSLDDPVSAYLPMLGHADVVRVHHLLAHTSGYHDYYPLGFEEPAMIDPIAPRDLVARIAGEPLDFAPGSRFSYSNTGYHIAGLILERVTGRDLPSLLAERVFEPAGMDATVLDDPPRDDPARAQGFTRFALGPLRKAYRDRDGWLYAAGALVSTAADLARGWLAFLDGRLLRPASLERMTAPALLADGSVAPAGLGVFVERRGPFEVIGHAGGLAGFSAQVFMVPAERSGVVVVANGGHVNATAVAGTLLAALVPGADLPDEPSSNASDDDRTALASVIDELQREVLADDRCTSVLAAYLDRERRRDAAIGLAVLGRSPAIRAAWTSERGGLRVTRASVLGNGVAVDAIVRRTSDGRLADVNVFPAFRAG